MRHLLAVFALTFLLVANCGAATVTYVIQDIGSFTGYTSTNLTATFPGTGFVGMYGNTGGNAPSYVHLFGLESTDYSRTILQVDIGALAGSSINSAILSFQLLDGFASGHGIQATSYTANGDLAYNWDPPDNLGVVSGTVSSGANSLDVTSLLAAQAAAGSGWLGLHLQGTDGNANVWTYTDPGFGYGPDRAQVRLTVDYNAAVPEPGAFGLAAGAFLALACWVRRNRAAR